MFEFVYNENIYNIENIFFVYFKISFSKMEKINIVRAENIPYLNISLSIPKIKIFLKQNCRLR